MVSYIELIADNTTFIKPWSAYHRLGLALAHNETVAFGNITAVSFLSIVLAASLDVVFVKGLAISQ